MEAKERGGDTTIKNIHHYLTGEGLVEILCESKEGEDVGGEEERREIFGKRVRRAEVGKYSGEIKSPQAHSTEEDFRREPRTKFGGDKTLKKPSPRVIKT